MFRELILLCLVVGVFGRGDSRDEDEEARFFNPSLYPMSPYGCNKGCTPNMMTGYLYPKCQPCGGCGGGQRPIIISRPPRPNPVPIQVSGRPEFIHVPIPIQSPPQKIIVPGPSIPVPVPVEKAVPYPVAVDRPYPVPSLSELVNIPIPLPELIPGPAREIAVPIPVPSSPMPIPVPVNNYVPIPVPISDPKYYPVPVINYLAPICRNYMPFHPFRIDSIPGSPCRLYTCKIRYNYVYLDYEHDTSCGGDGYQPHDMYGHFDSAESDAKAHAYGLGMGGWSGADTFANAQAGGYSDLSGGWPGFNPMLAMENLSNYLTDRNGDLNLLSEVDTKAYSHNDHYGGLYKMLEADTIMKSKSARPNDLGDWSNLDDVSYDRSDALRDVEKRSDIETKTNANVYRLLDDTAKTDIYDVLTERSEADGRSGLYGGLNRWADSNTLKNVHVDHYGNLKRYFDVDRNDVLKGHANHDIMIKGKFGGYGGFHGLGGWSGTAPLIRPHIGGYGRLSGWRGADSVANAQANSHNMVELGWGNMPFSMRDGKPDNLRTDSSAKSVHEKN